MKIEEKKGIQGRGEQESLRGNEEGQ